MQEIFNKLKSSSHYFAMYMLSIMMGGLVPYSITLKALHQVSKYISFAFSNLPGPRKPLYYKGRQVKKAWVVYTPTGGCGVAMALYSYNGLLKFSITADDYMMKDPRLFIDLFEQTLDLSTAKFY